MKLAPPNGSPTAGKYLRRSVIMPQLHNLRVAIKVGP
jgi:hypothetical protein